MPSFAIYPAWAALPSLLLFAGFDGHAYRQQDVTCTVSRAIRIDAKRLSQTQSTDHTVYRFVGDKLILQPTDRAAYEYGRLVAVDPLRLSVGNKTVLFDDVSRAAATVVHSDAIEVRVLRLSCS
jgi:hypothetical protein